MTREECIAILGPEDSARAIADALAQPPPCPELIALLQRVFNSPECLAPAEQASQLGSVSEVSA